MNVEMIKKQIDHQMMFDLQVIESYFLLKINFFIDNYFVENLIKTFCVKKSTFYLFLFVYLKTNFNITL